MKKRYYIFFSAIVILILITALIGFVNKRSNSDSLSDVGSKDEGYLNIEDISISNSSAEVSSAENDDLLPDSDEVAENTLNYYPDEPKDEDENIAYFYEKEQDFLEDNGQFYSGKELIFGKSSYNINEVVIFSDINDIRNVIPDYSDEYYKYNDYDEGYRDMYNVYYIYLSFDMTNLSSFPSIKNVDQVSITGAIDDTLVIDNGLSPYYLRGTDYSVDNEMAYAFTLQPQESRRIEIVSRVGVIKNIFDYNDIDYDDVKFYVRVMGTYTNAPDFYISEDLNAVYIEVTPEKYEKSN